MDPMETNKLPEDYENHEEEDANDYLNVEYIETDETQNPNDETQNPNDDNGGNFDFSNARRNDAVVKRKIILEKKKALEEIFSFEINKGDGDSSNTFLENICITRNAKTGKISSIKYKNVKIIEKKKGEILL